MATRNQSVRRADRAIPLVRVLGYYALIIGIGALLVRYVPVAQRAFVSPIVLPGIGGTGDLLRPEVSTPALPTFERGLITALVSVGILALVAPVAWVYMYTRRFRYDRALVQSVVILPLVVGGMVMIVKNSLALAFSLAGIVAAVRFRNTLKDPRDAVYIFLALGLGLAAGVHALDIGLVMSLGFNLLVLLLWRYNLAAVYGVERRSGTFAMGDPSTRLGRTAAQRDELRAAYADSDDLKADGALFVQGPDLATVRAAIEASLTGNASEWEYREPRRGAGDGNVVLPVLVRFKNKGTPLDVLGELDEYWAKQIVSAEYLPFATKK